MQNERERIIAGLEERLRCPLKDAIVSVAHGEPCAVITSSESLYFDVEKIPEICALLMEGWNKGIWGP